MEGHLGVFTSPKCFYKLATGLPLNKGLVMTHLKDIEVIVSDAFHRAHVYDRRIL
ncbi:MAG: hypothetical protein ACI9BD_001556 [Candidatus Marinamargulisbacteria bacterium]|jgi:hypothetical protein